MNCIHRQKQKTPIQLGCCAVLSCSTCGKTTTLKPHELKKNAPVRLAYIPPKDWIYLTSDLSVVFCSILCINAYKATKVLMDRALN